MHDMYDLQCLNAGITPGCYRRRGLLAPRCSVIASYAGDSSVLRSCYVLSVCYQAAPCCSDQGADLGQHVWDLDTRIMLAKILDFFFFDPATRFILYLLVESGTKWAHFTLR